MIPYSTQIDDEATDLPKKSEKLGEVEEKILITDPKNENGVTVLPDFYLILAGLFLFFVSLVPYALGVSPNVSSLLVYAMITGLHIFFLGIFQFLNPRDRANFELRINGKQIMSSFPLRTIILTSINLIFSAVGISCMYTIGSWYHCGNYPTYCHWIWPVGNIVGLTISIVIAMTTLLLLYTGHLSSKQEPK